MTAHDPRWQALLRPQLAARLFDHHPVPPLGSGSGFSWSTAWWLANLCHAAYLWNAPGEPPAAGYREAVLAAVGFHELDFVDEGAIQGVLAVRGDLVALAFRGTDDPRDWLVNARIEPKPWPGGGRLHGGFLEAFNHIAPRLAALRAGHAQRRWLVTGHSQGAAMAVLSSTMLQPLATYGFGCPRLGDAGFDGALATQPLHQVVNGGDLICRLPPSLGDYQTCLPGRVHRLGREVGGNQDAPFDVHALLQRTASPSQWTRPAHELADHAIVNYVAAIEEHLGDG